jgi:CBS domain-containing protein
MDVQELKDVMNQDVQVVSPEDTIKEAAQQMLEGDFGMMPVVEDGRMIGAISDRDIAIRAVAHGKDSSTKVRAVMSEGIVWASEGHSVDDAAKLMGKHQIRRLPIVTLDNKLVGIVALGDLAVESSEIESAGEALSEISRPS